MDRKDVTKMNIITAAALLAISFRATTPDFSTVEEYSDLWLTAHLIAGEAQCCDNTEQRYVASVAWNRVKDDRFPDTLMGVIYQDNPIQYACTVDGNFYREPTQENWENAQYIIDNGSVLPDEVVWQSDCVQGNGEYTRTSWHVYSY